MANLSWISMVRDAMIEFDKGDAMRIQHFIKVHAYSVMIAEGESVDDDTKLTIELVSLMHDIGIHPAEEKYGRCDGKMQEQEGPAPAREILERVGVDETRTERICYLIAHHHTYGLDAGIDYQILIEADFLVNAYEDHIPVDGIKSGYEKLFRTETGKKLCKQMYGL